MRKRILSSTLLIISALTIASTFLTTETAAAGDAGMSRGKVVVANRGSGTISVIDAATNDLLGTYSLPPGDATPEPMYVVYTPRNHRVFVGDRANDRVVVFDARHFAVKATVAAGDGVFHMWADPQGGQLWVNNDIDNTTSAIDPASLMVLATVPTPADLVALGGHPHDVILDPTGNFAYITVLGLPGDDDYVVKFSTATFEEVDRAAVGKDPHLSLTARNNLLYVPCQSSNVVVVLNRETMEHVTEIVVPGAHGAGMARNGKVFYTTNLTGGGPDGLFAIDTRTNMLISDDGVDTPYAVPHNIALAARGNKLFLTHSGPDSDKVTVYRIRTRNPLPVFAGEVTVGLNPFGIAYVP